MFSCMSACLPEAECQVALAEADGGVCGIELVCAHKATIVVHFAAANGLLPTSEMLPSELQCNVARADISHRMKLGSLIRTPQPTSYLVLRNGLAQPPTPRRQFATPLAMAASLAGSQACLCTASSARRPVQASAGNFAGLRSRALPLR